MGEQFSFPGFEAEHPTDRVFFAVMPDEAAIARIAELTAQLRRQHGLQGRAIAPQKLHQRVPVFLGSKSEVERVTSYHQE